MGIPSPFIGNAPSPLLTSRVATPLLLLKVDELSEVDFLGEGFELTQPALHLEEPLPSSLCTSPLVSCVQATKPGPPPSPLWPVAPPSLHELVEKNTFLDYNYDAQDIPAQEVCGRQRAFSDFTGMQLVKSGVVLEDLCLPDSESCLTDQEDSEQELHGYDDCDREQQCATHPMENLPSSTQEQEWHQYAHCDQVEQFAMYPLDHVQWFTPDQEWHESFCSDREQQCAMHPTQNVPWSDFGHKPLISPAVEFPLRPPVADGQKVYKPFWPYGSSWPFNCAPTTLEFQNLPSKLTQMDLTKVLDDEGFNGVYDFVFLPSDLRTGKSRRYAILNCLRHSHGLSLAAHFHGRTSWSVGNDGLTCKVKWSFPHQGLQDLAAKYRNHPSMHPTVPDELRPAMYHDGWQVPMPPPTKCIRAPLLCNKMHVKGDGPPNEASGREMREHECGQPDESSENHFHFESMHEWPGLLGPPGNA